MSQRVNFRQISKRFTHIDAELITAKFTTNPAVAEITVRFYPWWEHPLYLQATRSGGGWGFRSSCSEGERDVTVLAVNPLACRLSPRREVTDWEFCENHPISWRFQDQGQVFCNSEPDIPRIVEAVLARELPCVTRSVLDEYLKPQTWKLPYSLGYFPFTLYAVLVEELTRAGVHLHLPRAPQKRADIVALLLDGEDYVLADDFVVELPDFEHRAEWFDETRL